MKSEKWTVKEFGKSVWWKATYCRCGCGDWWYQPSGSRIIELHNDIVCIDSIIWIHKYKFYFAIPLVDRYIFNSPWVNIFRSLNLSIENNCINSLHWHEKKWFFEVHLIQWRLTEWICIKNWLHRVATTQNLKYLTIYRLLFIYINNLYMIFFSIALIDLIILWNIDEHFVILSDKKYSFIQSINCQLATNSGCTNDTSVYKMNAYLSLKFDWSHDDSHVKW